MKFCLSICLCLFSKLLAFREICRVVPFLHEEMHLPKLCIPEKYSLFSRSYHSPMDSPSRQALVYLKSSINHLFCMLKNIICSVSMVRQNATRPGQSDKLCAQHWCSLSFTLTPPQIDLWTSYFVMVWCRSFVHKPNVTIHCRNIVTNYNEIKDAARMAFVFPNIFGFLSLVVCRLKQLSGFFSYVSNET